MPRPARATTLALLALTVLAALAGCSTPTTPATTTTTTTATPTAATTTTPPPTPATTTTTATTTATPATATTADYTQPTSHDFTIDNERNTTATLTLRVTNAQNQTVLDRTITVPADTRTHLNTTYTGDNPYRITATRTTPTTTHATTRTLHNPETVTIEITIHQHDLELRVVAI